MFKHDRDFFILLRAGLWGKSEGNLSDSPEWEYIYNMSREHKVQGLIAEGISVLGVAQSVPASVFTRFFTDRACIIKMNMQVNKVQSELCGALESSGVPYAVLKGQAVAHFYDKPEIRRSGDIDFLVRESDFEKVNGLFSEYTEETQYHNHSDLHHSLHIDEVWVENHAAAKSYFTRRLDRVLENEKERMFLAEDFDKYESEGQTILIPNPEYTALFLLAHILRHLTTEGISVKQLCDWARYIYKQRGCVDRNKFEMMLQDSGIRTVWKYFSVFAVEWLALEPGFPLLYEKGHPEYGDHIWKTITTVRKIRSRAKEQNIVNFWAHYLMGYRDFIAMNNCLWKLSKTAFFERIWNKFGELPLVFLKKKFGINGARFKTERFK